MKQETAEALNELMKFACKIQGIDTDKHNVTITVCNAKIPAIVCETEELPFDEDNNCISCGHHEPEPLWYCPACGEYIPNIPTEGFE